MAIITAKRNLEKSFEKLKVKLFEAQRRGQKGTTKDYAIAFGVLTASVQVHLIECTGTSFDLLHKEREEVTQLPVPSNNNNDDLPKTLFSKFDNEGEE